ncbi:SdpA family antimicrobial peptide system protein [Corynebacterium felinum]|uniref:Antimicrobial peptide system SdpA family protein n=1 Tax=Corynebacterium felinum TaxID=131318 RepID=A0ABU2B630_9CORY|nr:SdpA family antimicrobial peptide system protein [Corynebacterium felinum]MDF5820097.1 SdpA family antimicrobial peptide system protein [Corynebacterium felinum]MDR7353841.1 antimicrobial peptide system SdpA family protein [Corynebacterium felinum]WJY96017.1 hypothetical protein CFELI_12180 [Corynebacterium felinum]
MTRFEYDPSATKLKATPIIAFITIATVIIVQMWAWLPASELYGSKARSKVLAVRTFTVQGWAFFTKSPREKRTIGFVRVPETDTWEPIARGPNLSLQYFFGLNRSARLTEVDTELLTNLIPEQNWKECDNVTHFEKCVPESPSITIDNPTTNPQICGDIVMTKSEPVPWAYRNLRDGMPGQVVKLNAVCHSEKK